MLKASQAFSNFHERRNFSGSMQLPDINPASMVSAIPAARDWLTQQFPLRTTLRSHDAPGLLWSFVISPLDACWMNEMAGQMWDVFEEQRLVTECNVIKQHEVLMQLPHIAHVRYNRQPHCPRKKAYCEELRYPREPGAVCLHIMNGARSA